MSSTTHKPFDVMGARASFPALHQHVHGQALVYLDSAASAQKPTSVLDAMRRHDETSHANVHRGVHTLSARATEAYEQARGKAQRFLGAQSPREIVFTKGCTEALNLVASGLAQGLNRGDEIVVSVMEHHSNIVPWQFACERSGASLKVAPMRDDGDLDLDALETLVGPRTRVVAVGHVSNALGTVHPVREIARIAHECGAVLVVDGAQGAPHLPIDVRALGADFYALAGHKMYGPTGIGVLYGRADLLEALPPYQGGGEMIETVTFGRSTFAPIPAKFEAGTPNITGAVGLGAAIDMLLAAHSDGVRAHEDAVLAYALREIGAVPGVRILGAPVERAGSVSFVVEGVHPHDVGTVLDTMGIAVRTGHHCAQPLMARLGVPATVRASFGLYNTTDDVDRLVQGLLAVKEMFG